MYPSCSSRRRHLRALVAAVALVGGLSAVACSQASDEPVATASQSIAGGTVDVSHQDVFLLGWQEGDVGALCTATLIAPNLLLTARHCVAPPNAGEGESVLCGDAGLGEPRPADAFFATNDPQPRQGSAYFRARDVRVPGVGVDTCGYDIALIILTENVPQELSTPAVPRIDFDPTPGEAYTAVGYGLTATGQPSGSRMQRAGLSVACQPGTCGDGVESTEFVGETGICSGDSGGPALDESGKVLGVVSRGGPGCSEPIYGSVAAWRDFIIQTADEAAKLGSYEPPFWVKTGSSDPPVVSGAAGAGGAGGGPTSGIEGDACQSSGECGSGWVCYAASQGDVGVCAATCSTTAECGAGLVCQAAGSVSVCVAPTATGDDSGGCAIAAAGAGASWAGALATLAAALLLARRRALK